MVCLQNLFDYLLVTVYHLVGRIFRVHIVVLGRSLASWREKTSNVLPQQRNLLGKLFVLFQGDLVLVIF